jgi:hypothetical protein
MTRWPRDGNWRCLSISLDDPRAMEQMGPNLEVSIAAVTGQGTTLAQHEVSALIDTGSNFMLYLATPGTEDGWWPPGSPQRLWLP